MPHFSFSRVVQRVVLFSVFTSTHLRADAPKTAAPAPRIAAPAVKTPAPNLGKRVNPFSAVDLEGNIVSTSDYIGSESMLPVEERKVVMLIIFTIPCHACEEEAPLIKALAKEFGNDVVFLYMNSGNPPKEVRSFVRRNQIPFKMLLDEESANFQELLEQYRFRQAFPVSLVFAPNGQLVGKPFIGVTPAENVRVTLREALKIAK